MTIVSGYCSETESTAWIAAGKTFTATELLQVDVAVEAASRMIDDYCGLEVGSFIAAATSSRVFVPQSYNQCYIDEVSSTAGLVVATDNEGDGVFEMTWVSTEYQLEPVNAIARGRPITAIRAVGVKFFPVFDHGGTWVGISGTGKSFYAPGVVMPLGLNHQGQATVQVTAKWGWPQVPTAIKQATLLQAAMIYQSKNAPAGLQGTPEMGSVRYPTGLHPQAVRLVEPYRKNAGGVLV